MRCASRRKLLTRRKEMRKALAGAVMAVECILLHHQVAFQGPCPPAFNPQLRCLTLVGAAGLFFLLIDLPIIWGELFFRVQLVSVSSLKVKIQAVAVERQGLFISTSVIAVTFSFACFFSPVPLLCICGIFAPMQKAAPSPSSSQLLCLLSSCLPPAPH